MYRRIVVSGLICSAALLFSHPARAQFNQYALPVEQGFLDSHLDLQYQYSRFDMGFGTEASNVSLLSIEGQYAFADRLEVGLNVPFVTNGWGGNGISNDETQFGNLMVNLKGRVFGLGETLALSLYLDTMVPTHSGDGSRKWAFLTPGVAASFRLLGALVGGAFQGMWLLNGEGSDIAYLGLDAYGAYTLLGILTFKLAVQFAKSIHPNSEATVFAVTPGVEADLLDIVRIGLSSRIATTDDAKLFYGGRASLLFFGGISF